MRSIEAAYSKIFPVAKLNWASICPAIVFAGIWIRIAQYFFCPSLWLDEAHTALVLHQPDFWSRLLHGTYFQTMPLGLISLTKVVISAFGPSEYALRAVPLLLGVGSVLLFWKLAARLLSDRATLIALLGASFSLSSVIFSVTFRHYSSDLFFSLWITSLSLHCLHSSSSSRHFLLLICGVLALLFSQSACFVLAGTGVSLLLCAFNERKTRPQIIKVLVLCIFTWLVTFSIIYSHHLSLLHRAPWIMEMWNPSFMPSAAKDLPQWSSWAWEKFSEGTLNLRHPLALWFVVLGGAYYLLHRDRWTFMILVLPALLVFGAAGLKLYPIGARLLAFLLPMTALFFAFAFDQLMEFGRAIGAFAVCVLFIILSGPIMKTAHFAFHPIKLEEIVPVMKTIQSAKSEGEIVYVFYAAADAYRYYNDHLLPVGLPVFYGEWIRAPHFLIEDFKRRTAGRRKIWVVLSHYQGVEEAAATALWSYLNSNWELMRSDEQVGASAYLFHSKTSFDF